MRCWRRLTTPTCTRHRSCRSKRCCGSCRRPTRCAGPSVFCNCSMFARRRRKIRRSIRPCHGCATRSPPRARSMPAQWRKHCTDPALIKERVAQARLAAVRQALASKTSPSTSDFQQGRTHARPLYLDDTQRPQGFDHARGNRAAVSRRTRSTSARTTSSSPSSSRSAPTARSRRLSIPTVPTASRTR